MGKVRDGNRGAKRLLGTFELPGGQRAAGELRLRGSRTLLRVHSDNPLPRVGQGGYVTGVTDRGECVSLVDCHTQGAGQTNFSGGSTKHHSEIFPHYVATGRQHMRPNEACVAGVHFTTTDLTSLFYDFDAFSHVVDARPLIDTVLRERRATRPVETGDWPQVFYFTGKTHIVEVDTTHGKVSVRHSPSYNMGGPEGAYIKNRIVVSIEPETPVSFEAAMASMHEVCCFLSLVAGRVQGIECIDVSTTELIDGHPCWLTIHQSFQWAARGSDNVFKPHPSDVPLDPIHSADEFRYVLADWLRRHKIWRVARLRYLSCLRKANKYGPDRLIAAANMFDILPASAGPAEVPLTEEVAKARASCVQILRELSVGVDRNAALSALGRMGKPSLPKKVAHRVSVVESAFGARFPDLQLVAATAVKCRNFYVHGSSGDVDFEKVEPLVPFLTDALEFVFAASDLLDAGWDYRRWLTTPKGRGHGFSRFRSGYDGSLAELHKALVA